MNLVLIIEFPSSVEMTRKDQQHCLNINYPDSVVIGSKGVNYQDSIVICIVIEAPKYSKTCGYAKKKNWL
jgi:hypothetical protein